MTHVPVSARMFLRLGLSLGCLLMVAGCSSGETKYGVVNGNGFSIELPGDAKRSETSQSTEVGAVGVVTYTAHNGDDYHAVAHNDYPADSVVDLDAAVEGAADAAGGTVVSDEPSTLAGNDARDAVITGAKSGGAEGTVFLTVVADGTRMYQILTIVEGKDTAVPESHARARTSFKLTP